MTLPSRYAGQSVSSGTLRPEDLLVAFLAVLEEDQPAYEDLSDHYEVDDLDALNDDERDELLGAVTDALNEAAPEGTYFGAHEGDGACFGFWLIAGDEPEGPTYKIVRFYESDDKEPEVRQTGLTLAEAQAHCQSEETHGGEEGDRWFDGYDEEV